MMSKPSYDKIAEIKRKLTNLSSRPDDPDYVNAVVDTLGWVLGEKQPPPELPIEVWVAANRVETEGER